MRKLRAPAAGRMAIASLAALAATLLVSAQDAAAQAAPPTVASNLCNYASNKPDPLRANLQQILGADGFIGLPPDQCPKFVKGLVKSCLTLVKDVTRCSTDANAMEGKIETLACDAQPTKDDVKSCKQTVKTDTQKAHAVASQPVKMQGDLVCRGSYADHFEDVCITGTVTTPPVPTICVDPTSVAGNLFSSIDTLVDFDPTPTEQTCDKVASTFVSGCNKSVADAARCNDTLNAARAQTKTAICQTFVIPEEQTACLQGVQDELSALAEATKNSASVGAGNCADLSSSIVAMCLGASF